MLISAGLCFLCMAGLYPSSSGAENPVVADRHTVGDDL